MCILAEIRCSACNSVKLLCVCDIEEITVITEWLVIVHIPIEGSYVQQGDPIELCVTIGDFHILKYYPMGQQNKHFLFRQFCTIHVFRSQTLAQLVMLYL